MNVKAAKQLIALNLVLVLLLSLFPGVAFAAEPNAAQTEPASAVTEEAAPVRLAAVDEVTPTADPEPNECILSPGGSVTVAKTANADFPVFRVEVSESGLYRFHVAPPSWGFATTGESYSSACHMILYASGSADSYDAGGMYDVPYYLSEGEYSFRLQKNEEWTSIAGDFDDSGEWTISFDRIPTSSLEVGGMVQMKDRDLYAFRVVFLESGQYYLNYSACSVAALMETEDGYTQRDYLPRFFSADAGDVYVFLVSPYADATEFSVAQFVPHGTFGAEGDNLSWSFDGDTGALTISGSGSMAADGYFPEGGPPWAPVASSVRTVTVANGVTDIAAGAFSGCYYLETASLPDSIVRIEENAFHFCGDLQLSSLPASLESIGHGAFQYCSSIRQITLPASLRSIGSMAFCDSGLRSVSIPASVSQIGDQAFSAYYLREITVDSANRYFKVVDDVLYSKDGKTLICCLPNCPGPFAIPDTVETIQTGAFSFGCGQLHSLFVPAGVKSIGSNSFNDLKALFYGGTAAQWDALGGNETWYTNHACVQFEASPADLLGASVRYTSSGSHETLRYQPEATGVYLVDFMDLTNRTRGRDYVSYGSMQLHLRPENGTAASITGFYEDQLPLVYVLNAGETYSVSLTGMESSGNEWAVSMQKLPSPSVSVGENTVRTSDRSYYYSDSNPPRFYLFTAPETGWYTFSAVSAEESSPRTVSLWDRNGIRMTSDTIQLDAGALAVVHITGDGETAQLTVQSTAVEGDCGEQAHWKLEADGTLVISGTGAMQDYDTPNPGGDNSTPWANFLNSIKSIRVESGITSIGTYAFARCSKVNAVSLPDTLETIGNDAFWQCSAITEITIPNGVTEIGAGAFENAEQLASVSIPGTVKRIGRGAFASSNISELTIPNGVEEIGEDAFRNNRILQRVSIADSVRGIGNYAFAGCRLLTDLRLPESLSFLGEGFVAYSDVRSLELPAGNQNFVMEDGVLFNRDKTTIYFAPPALSGSYVIPEGVTRLMPVAFYNCRDLTEMTFPESMTYLGDGAFHDCGIQTIRLPSTMRYVDAETLSECYELTDIYFDGSVYDWNVVLDGGSTSATVHFSEGMQPADVSLGEHQTTLTDENWKAVYRFVAPQDGVYCFRSTDEDMYASVRVTDMPGNNLDNNRFREDESRVFGLSAGESAYILMRNTSNSETTFSWEITTVAVTDLTEGTHTSSYADESGTRLFRITPAEDVRLVLSLSDGSPIAYALMDHHMNTLRSVYYDDSSVGKMDLTAGETYYLWFSHSHYAEEYEWTVSFQEPAKPITVALGENTVYVDDEVLCPFTPSVSGTYRMEGTTYGSDTYLTLYDENRNWIASDDDGAGNVQFLLEYPMEAGKTYYLGVRFYSRGEGTITFNVSANGAAIVRQPQPVVCPKGEAAVFSVEATGTDLTYQWQYRTSETGKWYNSSSATQGYNTPALTVVAEQRRDGYQYRCVVTDGFGNAATSEPATLTIMTAPEITAQPQNLTASVGETAEFAVEAAGAELTYQWQYQSAGSTTWSNSGMTGAKTDRLQVPATAARNGQKYRCVITNAAGSVTSEPASLTVLSKPEITTQPQSVTAAAGDTVQFTVQAKGSNLTYQWQYKTAGSSSWSNSTMTGAKTATMTVPVTTGRNGYQYRCVITNAAGSVTSEPATLTALAKPAITTQPQSVTANAGDTVKFTVKATGSELTYQWQYKTTGSSSWSNSTMTGAKTASMTVPVKTGRNGYQYRCVVKNAVGSVTSEAAKLTVLTTLRITAQPKSTVAAPGTKADFTVKAEGSGLKYQWQYRTSATGTWNNSSSATQGYNTAKLTVVAEQRRSGYQYRCIVTDSTGKKVTSSAATLQVQTLAITKQPVNASGKVGETVSFTVQAKGGGLTYQWQFAPAGSSTWKNSGMTGAKTTTLQVPVTAARNGQQYRCVVTDGAGNTLTTQTAVLRVTG